MLIKERKGLPSQLIAVVDPRAIAEHLSHRPATPYLQEHKAARSAVVIDDGDVILLNWLRGQLGDIEDIEVDRHLAAKRVELAIALGDWSLGVDLFAGQPVDMHERRAGHGVVAGVGCMEVWCLVRTRRVGMPVLL